jgi:hypothetical protein
MASARRDASTINGAPVDNASIGIALGVIAGVILLIPLTCCLFNRCKRRRTTSTDVESGSEATVTNPNIALKPLPRAHGGPSLRPLPPAYGGPSSRPYMYPQYPQSARF